MDMQILPWIKDDIAIEIIGKMIAEQTEKLHIVAAEYRKAGFSFDSGELKADAIYQEAMGKISDFKREVNQIYDGDQVEKLYQKVEGEYVTHLNLTKVQNEEEISGSKRFFGDTVGFGKSKPTDDRAFYSGNQYRDDQAASVMNDAGSISVKEDIHH